MKAIVYSEYGPPNDVLRLEEIEKPSPGDDEVLIRVRAVSINPLDWVLLRGRPYLVRPMIGLSKPKSGRVGVDVAGEVEAAGRNVTRFKPGDAVFGGCEGALAEYVCTAQSAVVTKPENVTFEEAAAVNVAGITALQSLRDKGRVQPGQHALINGAGGGVGSFAVQIAKSFGAEVTGVCSTGSVDLVRSLGADHVIDYTRDDFTRSGRRYDVILDSVGNHPLSAIRRCLTPSGIYVTVGSRHSRWLAPVSHLIKVLAVAPFVREKLTVTMAKPNEEDLTILRDLMATGNLKPAVGRVYPLSDTAQAMAYLGEGHARGKIVIRVG